ncbi:hypothetical protein AN926_01215 [Thermus scotoductus]|jgi:hypothetical protein|uniref:Cytochrome B n=1 Tax=Thermus scotoductus TaxID=37636 RepID=A0A0N0ZS86_THESC|nr:hypothetical protein [Thermus sp. NMX2.A1]ETN89525.1 hypothetical protein TNMX_01485 [Thermus sp. NMX2.A1]KPD32849.1 hypothetical protein AN926_01215 [Thermus scotoductus]HAR68326.1 hypothetical protein [Thermus scotoductus]
MYEAVLFLHNLVRWVVLAFGFLALWRPGAKEGAFFAHALTLQVVLGILLAFVSPLFQGALANLEAVMQTPGEARYFVAEHWVGGLVALGLAHAGLSQARKGKPRARLLFALALALVLLSIPWFRPLLRL